MIILYFLHLHCKLKYVINVIGFYIQMYFCRSFLLERYIWILKMLKKGRQNLFTCVTFYCLLLSILFALNTQMVISLGHFAGYFEIVITLMCFWWKVSKWNEMVFLMVFFFGEFICVKWPFEIWWRNIHAICDVLNIKHTTERLYLMLVVVNAHCED